MTLKNELRKAYLFKLLRNMTFFGALMVPMFTKWARLSYFEIFTLQLWFMIATFVLEVPTGVIADRFGRKISLSTGALLVALGAIVYTLRPNFLLFLVAETLWGAGAALTSGADKAFLYDLLKENGKEQHASKIFATYQNAGLIGIIIALPLGTIIAGLNLVQGVANYALTMSLTAVPMLLAMLVGLALHEPKVEQKIEENYIEFAIDGLKEVFRNKKLLALALEFAVLECVLFFVFWMYQPLLLNEGLQLSILGFVAAAFNIFSIILVHNVKRLEKIFSAKTIITTSGIGAGVAYLTAGTFHSLVFALPSVFLIVGMKFLRQPILSHYMNTHIATEKRATVLSGVSMVTKITQAMFYPFIGFLTDLDLNFTLVILGLLTIAFTLASKTTKEHFM